MNGRTESQLNHIVLSQKIFLNAKYEITEN